MLSALLYQMVQMYRYLGHTVMMRQRLPGVETDLFALPCRVV